MQTKPNTTNNSHVIRGLLLFTFVVLLMDLMFDWGLSALPGLSVKNALLYVLLLVFGIQTAARGRGVVIDFPQIHAFFFLLLMIAMLSWATNTFIGGYSEYAPRQNFMVWKTSLLDHYLFFLLFFLGARSRGDVLWLQRWILFFVALASFITVVDTYDVPDLGFVENRSEGRVKGPLGQPNDYGIFNAVFLPIMVAKAWAERGGWRTVFILGALATFWALLLTVSRGAMVALVVGSVLALYLLRHHVRAVYLRRAAVIGGFGFLAVMLVIGEQYLSLIMERTVVTAETSDLFALTSGRTRIWSDAVGLMAEQPWTLITGYGWNTTFEMLGITMHSRYLTYFFELGVFGLSAFVALLFSILYWARMAIASRTSDAQLTPLAFGFVFGMAALSVGIVGGNLYSPWYFIWAYAGVAMRGVALLLLDPRPASATPVSRMGAEQGVEPQSLSRERA